MCLLLFNKDHLSVYTEPCLHKTPKRSLSRKSRIPTFSSPVNDTDLQQEIFWDPHSPIAHGLGNINKIQISGCLSRECNCSVLEEGDRLFSRVSCDRTRGNSFKVTDGRFRLDIRKKVFTVRVVRY